MAFLLQPRTQSQEGTQRDSRVSVARAPAAPGRPLHFLCLFLLEPASPPLTPPCVSTASCSQPPVPTTPSLGPFLWQLPLFFARPRVSGCICPGLPIGSETCHLANELPPFLCKRGPPAQCKKSFPGSGLFRQSCPGRCDNVQAVLRNM